MSKIQNLIFDMGNVMFGFDPSYIVAQVLGDGVDPSPYLVHLFDNEAWQRMDEGVLDSEDWVSELASQHQFSPKQCDHVRELIAYFPDHLILNEPLKALFEKFVNEYGVYILSNFQAQPFDILCHLNPFLLEAKGMVVSAKEQLMKPDPRLYQLLLDRYQLDPETCLFIDDLPANINTAIALGMDGIVFQTNDQLHLELQNRGIL